MRVDGDTHHALDHLVAAPLEHHLLQRPWGHQHVVTAGPPDGAAVVLVHGWPQHWLAWRDVLPLLAVRHRLLLVDLRGMGWSSLDGGPGLGGGTPSVAQLGDDLVHVLDELESATAVVVGHDWGGWVAFRAALDHPTRFRRCVGLSIVPPWLDRTSMLRRLPSWSYVLAMALAGHHVARRAEVVRAMVRHTTSVPVWQRREATMALASYVERASTPSSAAMARHLYTTLVRTELPRAWGPRDGSLPAPAHVLLGEHESISRPELFWSRCRANEVHVHTASRAGHWLPEEAPGAVARLVERVVVDQPAGTHPISGSPRDHDLQPAGEGPAPHP